MSDTLYTRVSSKVQRILYWTFKATPGIGPSLVTYACKHFSGLPGHVRLRGLFHGRSLTRPHLYLGFHRALHLTENLGYDRFSILEFGVSEGNGLLYLQNICRAMQSHPKCRGKEIKLFGFDTFEGLPEVQGSIDGNSAWKKGDYPSDLERLEQLVDPERVTLVPGLFSDTLPLVRDQLKAFPPLFIIVDCDLYYSTVAIFDGIVDVLPKASYWYFDDADHNFFSERAGERLAIRDFNACDKHPFEFCPDYKALAFPVPSYVALTKLFFCVAGDYVDLSRRRDEPYRLRLDPEEYELFVKQRSQS